MQTTSNLVYSEQQIRKLEKLAVEHNITTDMLMQRAGTAVFESILESWPATASIIVFCGSGNNGGDGYVVAHLAYEKGIDVRVRYLGDLGKLKGEALGAMKACKSAGVEIEPFDKREEITADVFVDGLLGIGLKEAVREFAAEAIDYINNNLAKIIAIDVPSGICTNTGSVLGAAVCADYTVTFMGIKLGLLTGQAPDYCGEIICDDLSLPWECFSEVNHDAEIITLENYSSWLMPRARTANKGNFGHVLVIGGEIGMTGAPRMAAEAAARVGAGVVTVATKPEHVAAMNIMQPELMCHGVKTKKDLLPLLAKANVVAIGPGLGQSEWAKQLLEVVIAAELPLVVDADALNLLAQKPKTHKNWILTPHPGEAARMLKIDSKAIQADRFQAVRDIKNKYGGICILKGAGSIVLDEAGTPLICMAGNPGMASGGMGDVLTGVIAGLVAQGIPLAIAASCGVCLHAEAADWSAAEDGERGMLATDLLPYLRQLVN
jgi:ADP-dependent NAD(P)H-hydrate dehydratase / NAD(P)H-hydrate epimerase